MNKFIFRLALFYLTALVFFGWGISVYKFKIFPYHNQIFQSTVNGIIEIKDFFRLNHHHGVLDILRLDHQEVRSSHDFYGLKIVDKEFKDDGFLLISRYSKHHNQTIVELLNIASNQVVHTWIPNLELIFAVATDFGKGFNTRMAYRSQHPLLMPDGDIIFTSGEGPLVRIDACGGLKWVINRHFHHSIELDSAGNIVVPIVSTWHEEFPGNLYVRNDGVAIVSPTGKILSEHSIHKAFLENGYRGLVFGVGEFEDDRYHLNDVQPLRGQASSDGVLLSVRNLSSVALFIPKTGKIQWLQTGPWLNQHDINDMGDGRYSIFGNNVIRGGDHGWVSLDGHSDIYLFNPSTGHTETPYSKVLAQVEMATGTGGRVKILANDDAFIEETDSVRLMRISRDQVRWEYVHRINANSDGAEQTNATLNWSRYLSGDSIKTEWLEALSCE